MTKRDSISRENLTDTQQYKNWLVDLKQRLQLMQMKAAVAVNQQLLLFYWQLGADIVEKQQKTSWGSGFLQQLSIDLMSDFPEMKGFSYRNLRIVKQWHLFYSQQFNNLATSC